MASRADSWRRARVMGAFLPCQCGNSPASASGGSALAGLLEWLIAFRPLRRGFIGPMCCATWPGHPCATRLHLARFGPSPCSGAPFTSPAPLRHFFPAFLIFFFFFFLSSLGSVAPAAHQAGHSLLSMPSLEAPDAGGIGAIVGRGPQQPRSVDAYVW